MNCCRTVATGFLVATNLTVFVATVAAVLPLIFVQWQQFKTLSAKGFSTFVATVATKYLNFLKTLIREIMVNNNPQTRLNVYVQN